MSIPVASQPWPFNDPPRPPPSAVTPRFAPRVYDPDAIPPKPTPRQAKRRKEITREYAHGDFEVVWLMDTERLSKRQAEKQLAEDRAAQLLYDRDPAEAEFQAHLPEWHDEFQKGIRSGNIFYDDMLASPVPLYRFELTLEQWARFKAMLSDMVPWKTPGQEAAFASHFRQAQRAYAMKLFAAMTAQARRDHWDTWWHSEVPPPNWPSWNEGLQKWRVLRAELERQIQRDERTSQ